MGVFYTVIKPYTTGLLHEHRALLFTPTLTAPSLKLWSASDLPHQRGGETS